MANPELAQIVRERLKVLGFDGLYDPGECACLLDDLMPCDDPQMSCTAGYKAPGNSEFNYLVQAKKSKTEGTEK